MIVFRDAPLPQGTARVVVATGADLDDALAQFGVREDCIGCSTAAAAPNWTPADSIERVLRTFSPLAVHGPIIRPFSGPGMLLRGGRWSEVNIDAGAQRLRTVRVPAELVGAQRLLAVNDLRGNTEARPVIAIGLWAHFAHPIVRMGARLAGARDGLAAEIALAVHPDWYVLIDRDRGPEITWVIATPDPIAGELLALGLRQTRSRVRGVGPWEDPLVQSATELGLGARGYEEIDIDAFVSPTLSSEQRALAVERVSGAAELIGVRTGA